MLEQLYTHRLGGFIRGGCELFGRCAPDPPDDLLPGGMPAGTPGEEETDTDCDDRAGSFVVCTNQTLGESLPIAGTPFSLEYLSSRVPGWAVGRRFTIPIDVPEGNPPSLVVVEVGVAGRLFTDTLDAVDQDYDFEWDGRDAYGRLLRGGHRASVRLGFRYFVSPRVPEWRTSAVGQFATTFSGVSIDGHPYRHAVLFSDPSEVTLGQPGAVTAGGGDLQLGGWTLSAHHVYDPGAGVLYLGNGQRLSHVDEGRFISLGCALRRTKTALPTQSREARNGTRSGSRAARGARSGTLWEVGCRRAVRVLPARQCLLGQALGSELQPSRVRGAGQRWSARAATHLNRPRSAVYHQR